MSNWRLRSPNKFPPVFIAVIELALRNMLLTDDKTSEWLIMERGLTASQARSRADQFRCFRWNLRQFPGFHLHDIELKYDIIIRTRPDPGAYDRKMLEVRMQFRLTEDALIEALAGN